MPAGGLDAHRAFRQAARDLTEHTTRQDNRTFLVDLRIDRRLTGQFEIGAGETELWTIRIEQHAAERR